MNYHSAKRLILGVLLGLVLFLIGLSFNREYIQSIISGGESSQCATCGTYKVTLHERGWPFVAYEAYAGSDTLAQLPGEWPPPGWQAAGVIGDVLIGIAVGEITIATYTYIKTKL